MDRDFGSHRQSIGRLALDMVQSMEIADFRQQSRIIRTALRVSNLGQVVARDVWLEEFVCQAAGEASRH